MINVVFKNLDKSELARDAAIERAESLVSKFPDLQKSNLRITLEMHNSPLQAGPDLFTVRFQVENGRYGGVLLQKSATNLYTALADVSNHMLERLNRLGDRSRIIRRRRAKNVVASLESDFDISD